MVTYKGSLFEDEKRVHWKATCENCLQSEIVDERSLIRFVKAHDIKTVIELVKE